MKNLTGRRISEIIFENEGLQNRLFRIKVMTSIGKNLMPEDSKQ